MRGYHEKTQTHSHSILDSLVARVAFSDLFFGARERVPERYPLRVLTVARHTIAATHCAGVYCGPSFYFGGLITRAVENESQRGSSCPRQRAREDRATKNRSISRQTPNAQRRRRRQTSGTHRSRHGLTSRWLPRRFLGALGQGVGAHALG